MTNQEINEQVARKLGWTELFLSENIGCMDIAGKRHLTDRMNSTVPKYCERIEAAWEIVGTFHPRLGMSLYQHLQPPYGWTCLIYTTMTEEPTARERADTAPLAICKAFLKLP